MAKRRCPECGFPTDEDRCPICMCGVEKNAAPHRTAVDRAPRQTAGTAGRTGNTGSTRQTNRFAKIFFAVFFLFFILIFGMVFFTFHNAATRFDHVEQYIDEQWTIAFEQNR